MKLRNLFSVILCFVLPLVAFGKAAYWGKTEMINRSEIIAVVTILKVEPTKKKRDGWTYSEAASAKVEQVLKGDLPPKVVLYGGEDFICAQVHYKPGRHLVFLRHDKDLIIGVNWHLGVREIKNGKLEWFIDDKSLELKSAALSNVLAEVSSLVKK